MIWCHVRSAVGPQSSPSVSMLERCDWQTQGWNMMECKNQIDANMYLLVRHFVVLDVDAARSA